MKIGLCACYDTYNYGSQLQSYASLVVLQELGCDVSLIKYKKKISFSLIVNSIPRVLNPSFVRRRIRIYNNRRMEKCNKVYSETISNRKCQHQRFIADHFEKYVNIMPLNAMQLSIRRLLLVVISYGCRVEWRVISTT